MPTTSWSWSTARPTDGTVELLQSLRTRYRVTELAALKIVESTHAPGEALVVILTASSGATGATCLLSPVRHLCVVHAVDGRRVPVLAWRRSALRERTIVVCPTRQVAAAFSAL